jgi:hypothetical protein
VKALAREYPPEHQVPDLQSPSLNVATMVAAQVLLVSSSTECRLTPGFFKQEEGVADEVGITKLIEGEHPWRSELDVGRKNSLRPIDQEERGLPGWIGCTGAERPEDRLEIV